MVNSGKQQLVDGKHPVMEHNNVLLVKIEGPVWYTIYHPYLLQNRAKQAPVLVNQPMGIWDIYDL